MAVGEDRFSPELNGKDINELLEDLGIISRGRF